jgi:SAM-dependent methyltransferase
MLQSFEIIEDIKCYAPKLAFSNEGYLAETFEKVVSAEDKNFWYISRYKILQQLFSKYIGPETQASVLEIGCGTGNVLQSLSKFKNYKLMGAEIHLEGLKFAKKRHSDIEFIQMDATNIPFEEKFEAVGAFDVLEHIEEDELVMKNVYRSLKKKGYFFVTVPQYMFMWSETDEIDCHKRRYSRKELLAKIKNAGFKTEYCSSFVFTLFPFMLVSRLMKRRKKRDKTATIEEAFSELISLPSYINSIFKQMMLLDEWFFRLGIPLPFGGSLVVVARKE